MITIRILVSSLSADKKRTQLLSICSIKDNTRTKFSFPSNLFPFVAGTQPMNALAVVFDSINFGAPNFVYSAYSMGY